jgi:hypothetical protein
VDPAAEPVPDEIVVEPAPRRPWVRRVLLGMLAGVVVVAVVPLVVAYPYLRDDYVLEGVVRAVALDWRDFGRDKAQARLEYELDHRGIGMWVGDDDCVLLEEDGVRRVTCAWRAEVRVPLAEAILPLAFRSSAGIDGTGALVP